MAELRSLTCGFVNSAPWVRSTGSCSQRALLGHSADTRPFHVSTGRTNEKPPHHSWLPSSTFLNATESCILLQPADTAPNISPASSLPFYFSMHAIVPGLFCFCAKAFSPQCQGYNSPVCRAECDLSLLLS